MGEVIFHSMADSAYLWTVMHVADEKGVRYTHTPLAHGTPEHLTLHPFGKMPVLQHGENFIYESLAIAHYIDRAFEGPALQPRSALFQAHMLRWISIVNAYVFPIMNRFMKERLVKRAWGFDVDEAFIAGARAPLLVQMRLIEEAVAAHDFLAGEEMTLADSFLLPHLLFFARTPEGAALLERAPAARAWLDRMLARPSFSGSAMAATYDAFSSRQAPGPLAWAID